MAAGPKSNVDLPNVVIIEAIIDGDKYFIETIDLIDLNTATTVQKSNGQLSAIKEQIKAVASRENPGFHLKVYRNIIRLAYPSKIKSKSLDVWYFPIDSIMNFKFDLLDKSRFTSVFEARPAGIICLSPISKTDQKWLDNSDLEILEITSNDGIERFLLGPKEVLTQLQIKQIRKCFSMEKEKSDSCNPELILLEFYKQHIVVFENWSC